MTLFFSKMLIFEAHAYPETGVLQKNHTGEKKAKEKVAMTAIKGSHRSLMKPSTDIHKSRPWPAGFQLLRASQEVANPTIQVTTAVPSAWEKEKSTEKTVSYSQIASTDNENH